LIRPFRSLMQVSQNRGERGIFESKILSPGGRRILPGGLFRSPPINHQCEPAGVGALTSQRPLWKRPDVRRLPDDTRRAPQPNLELQAFGAAESNLCKLRGRKTRQNIAFLNATLPSTLTMRRNDKCPHLSGLKLFLTQ
jgi:hypothetical protein